MIEFITRMFSTIDGCEWDRLKNFFASDSIYERPGYPPLEGLDRIETFYRDERVIASGKHDVTDHYEKPGGIMVIGNFTGILRDGRTVSLRYADAYQIADGLITHRETFFYTPLV